MDKLSNRLRIFLLFIGVLLGVFGIQTRAEANDTSAILYDYDAGRILYEKNADEVHYPASLTKMMTLYVTFEALSKEQVGLNSCFPVSHNASIQEPSKLGLLPGQYISLNDLISGIAVQSANDGATALAEGLGGNIQNFSNMMNLTAQQLGMLHSYFENPTGLPNPNQATTARDMLKLAIALYRDFPEHYSVFGTHYFNYRGHQYKNHNHLLATCQGVDGIKTGYIHAEGYNLVGSATRNGHRLFAVVLGGKTAPARDHLMRWLFNQGFSGETNFEAPPMPEAVVHKKLSKKATSKAHKKKHHAKKQAGSSQHKAKKAHKKKKRH